MPKGTFKFFALFVSFVIASVYFAGWAGGWKVAAAVGCGWSAITFLIVAVNELVENKGETNNTIE